MRDIPFIPAAAGMAPEASDLDPILRPARTFGRPAAVLQDPKLTVAEKRAILASWASDACAVESMPTLRKPSGLEKPVPFEEIMDALHALDMAASAGPGTTSERSLAGVLPPLETGESLTKISLAAPIAGAATRQ